MFRELTRKNKMLSEEKCIDILKNEKRGVLSVIGDGGYPYGMPMNHFFSEADGKIYFHCGKGGHRLDSIKKDGRVSFCVYDSGVCRDGEWALNINNVIVFGKAEIVDDIDTVTGITRMLCYKFTSDEKYIEDEIAAHGAKTLLIALTPEHICGKSVVES